MRLLYNIAFIFPSGTNNDGVVTLIVNGNNTGAAPQSRIYKQGDAPPAFASMVVAPAPGIPFRQIKSALVPGTYIVEYKDTIIQRVIGKIILPNNPYAVSPDFSEGSIDVFADRVRLNLDHVNFSVSIDNMATWKDIVGGFAEWSNSELVALGFGINIPTMRFRLNDSGGPSYDSGLFGRGNDTAVPCADLAGGGHTYYWSPGTWGTGVVLFTDAALTTRLTGYAYIVGAVEGGGNIFRLNPATGVVGVDTGIAC